MKTNKRIAFVASYYNEVNQIKLQLLEKNITNIDVFPYNTEPDEYDIIEYNVRPNKEYAEILDLAQCLRSHGFPDDTYIPPERQILSEDNKQAIEDATKHLKLENLELLLDEDSNLEITRKLYNSQIQEIIDNKQKLTNMTPRMLKKKLMLENDPVTIIAILTVMFDKLHNTDMTDNFGNPTRGYIAKNGKTVVNFVNGNSIGWISELWSELLPQQSEYHQAKYIKSLKTRGLNMLKDKSSIWGLRFFIEYLIEQDKEEIEVTIETPESGTPTITYEGFDEENIPF